MHASHVSFPTSHMSTINPLTIYIVAHLINRIWVHTSFAVLAIWTRPAELPQWLTCTASQLHNKWGCGFESYISAVHFSLEKGCLRICVVLCCSVFVSVWVFMHIIYASLILPTPSAMPDDTVINFAPYSNRLPEATCLECHHCPFDSSYHAHQSTCNHDIAQTMTLMIY